MMKMNVENLTTLSSMIVESIGKKNKVNYIEFEIDNENECGEPHHTLLHGYGVDWEEAKE